jgi:hypothetical protein
MVDKPNPIPPDKKPQPASPDPTEKIPKGFSFGTEGREFAGLKFSADEWNKLMNTLFKSLGDYINKTFQKMTEKMKKDWRHARGED